MRKILVIGASGQIGTDLTLTLRKHFGNKSVIAADIKYPSDEVLDSGIFEKLDVMNKKDLVEIIHEHNISQIYHLAAILSGKAEEDPMFAWKLNMESFFNVINAAKENQITQVFWPSSIAAFGINSKKTNTPQWDIMDPNTVYGISKIAGERWMAYYNQKYNMDIRSIRYPGLISYKTEAGGGTTDYAVEIFYEAVKTQKYTCFLKENTTLPMMYMDDAIRATIELMEVDKEKLSIDCSYNLAGISFSPKELAKEVKKVIPNFEMSYKPDFRQDIAES
ncbi:MAG: NAD-dependent epimerase/dehydratase family protein, partial [Bacteroidales bacterium]|nr:NAD-dependent epimerase/dehydratase family protein [Bacteroidales bacterium]